MTKPIKLLIAGAEGQVGREIVEQAKAGGPTSPWSVIACGRGNLDITQPNQVQQIFTATKPDVVINAAAYTAVDKAEDDSDTAFAINQHGVRHLAEQCAEAQIPLVHISTDYVFDGKKTTPYIESDPPNPLGVYGESKLAGETAIRDVLAQHYILRTSWVFGRYGNNFVKTMLRLAKSQTTIKVVDDQVGSPTAARDIAACLLRLAEDATGATRIPPGLFHLGGTPYVSWYGFSMEILADAVNTPGFALQNLVPIPSTEFPTRAVRPKYTCLDNGKLATWLPDLACDWRANLHRLKTQLLEDGS